MAICTTCGRDLPAGANFCEYCGQKVADEGLALYAVKDPIAGPLYEVRLSHYFRKGWETFLQYPVGFIGFSLILILVMGVVIFLQQTVPVVGFLLTAVIVPLHAGLYIVSAKLLQRRPCRFADFFSGFHYYQSLMIFGLIYGVIAIIIQILQHYPLMHFLWQLAALFFTLLYFFTPLLVIDRRLGWLPAMELCRLAVQRRPLNFLGFLILGGVILVAGAVALGVGLLVTLPLVSGAITAAYADLFGLQSQEY